MASFSVVRKKTPFQKHREEDAEKKQANEEAARLYEEFVEWLGQVSGNYSSSLSQCGSSLNRIIRSSNKNTETS